MLIIKYNDDSHLLKYKNRFLAEKFFKGVGVIRRGWHYIAVSILICLALAALYLFQRKTEFKGSARLLILHEGGRPWSAVVSDGEVRFVSFTDHDDTPTHIMVIRSPAILERALASSGLRDWSVEEVGRRLKVTRPDPTVKMLEIGYQAATPGEAVKMVDAIVVSYKKFVEDNYQKSTASVQLVDAPSAVAQRPEQTAVVTLALLIGCGLGVGCAFLADRSRRLVLLKDMHPVAYVVEGAAIEVLELIAVESEVSSPAGRPSSPRFAALLGEVRQSSHGTTLPVAGTPVLGTATTGLTREQVGCGIGHDFGLDDGTAARSSDTLESRPDLPRLLEPVSPNPRDREKKHVDSLYELIDSLINENNSSSSFA